MIKIISMHKILSEKLIIEEAEITLKRIKASFTKIQSNTPESVFCNIRVESGG